MTFFTATLLEVLKLAFTAVISDVKRLQSFEITEIGNDTSDRIGKIDVFNMSVKLSFGFLLFLPLFVVLADPQIVRRIPQEEIAALSHAASRFHSLCGPGVQELLEFHIQAVPVAP